MATALAEIIQMEIALGKRRVDKRRPASRIPAKKIPLRKLLRSWLGSAAENLLLRSKRKLGPSSTTGSVL
jgi:hypothetical protein